MATNVAWHETRGIKLELYRADLGNPEIPGLLEEILTPPAGEGEEVTDGKRDRHMIKCMECHETGACGSVAAGKGPWVSIRKSRFNGKVQLVPAHLPITHKAGEGESAEHRELNRRVARVAVKHGYPADTEVRTLDGKLRHDALITGEGGRKFSWETQHKPSNPAYIRHRDRKAAKRGVIANWHAILDDAEWIGRVNWSRSNRLPWQEIAEGRDIPVVGGFRRLLVWKCTFATHLPCPDGRHPCWQMHYDLVLPSVLGQPDSPQSPVTIDHLVVGIVSQQVVPVAIADPRNPHSSFRLWVPAAERDQLRELRGEELDGDEDGDERDDTITFDEDAEEDRGCHYGEPRRQMGSPRPVRDSPGFSFASTVKHAKTVKMPDPDRLFSGLTPAEIQAIADEYGRKPSEIGPCKRCWRPTLRYGGFGAHELCQGCRRATSIHAAKAS